MNRESELRDILISALKTKFQILDEQNLLLYLNLRYQCLNNKYQNEKFSEPFMRFVLRELYIIPETYGITFGDEDFCFAYASENSLTNIFDDWNFSIYQNTFLAPNGQPLDTHKYEKSIYDKVTKKAKRKLQKYKDSQYKDDILKYFKLVALNEFFNVTITDVDDLDELEQVEIRLSDEELLERYIQAADFDTLNVKIITENNLRDYLYNHLSLIEEGLTPLGKEIPAQEGRIDILARDKNGNIVILELKTEIDKRLIWQCLYYPEIIKNQYQTKEKIRCIAVCPEYPDYLLVVLRKLPNIELIQYNVVSTNHTITQLQFTEI